MLFFRKYVALRYNNFFTTIVQYYFFSMFIISGE